MFLSGFKSFEVFVVVLVALFVVALAAVGLSKYYLRAYFEGRETLFFPGFERIKHSNAPSSLLFNDNQSLKCGDILARDFRDEQTKQYIAKKFKDQNKNLSSSSSYSSSKEKPSNTIRIVSLNMEMGRYINQTIEQLKELDPDIVCLQEADINTKRTDYTDTIAEIATVLKMNSLFAVELVIPKKKYNSTMTGYVGNGILSKFDFVETKGLTVPCARQIRRHTSKVHNEAVAVCEIPHKGWLGCYSMHLEPNWSGVNGRITQYLQILEDVRQQKDIYLKKQEREQEQNQEKSTKKAFYQFLAGDFNTICHGIARCWPTLACDWESGIQTLGYYEAEYFQKKAVEYGNKCYNLNFSDPFDKRKDITFHFFKGLYQAKLDWILLSDNIKPVQYQVCPVHRRCSDHQWISVDCQLS